MDALMDTTPIRPMATIANSVQMYCLAALCAYPILSAHLA